MNTILLSENLIFELPDGHKVNIRVAQTVEGKAKVHAMNIKVNATGKDGGSTSGIMLPINKDYIINRDQAKENLNGKDNKKLYKEIIDDIGGLILYAKNELDAYNKDQTIGEKSIQNKISEFEKLYRTDRKTYKKYVKASKSNKILEWSIFDGIEFI